MSHREIVVSKKLVYGVSVTLGVVVLLLLFSGKFTAFDFKKKVRTRAVVKDKIKTTPKKGMPKRKIVQQNIPTQNLQNENTNSFSLGCFGWTIIIFGILYLFSLLSS